jgi:hypothetical protein
VDTHGNKRHKANDGAASTVNDNPDEELVHWNDDPATEEETIDEPDSRPKHPLPLITPAQLHTMNSAPYTFPDPEDMSGLPTAADENPHLKFTWADPAPAVLPDGDCLKIPFTNTVFPASRFPSLFSPGIWQTISSPTWEKKGANSQSCHTMLA